MKIKQVSTHFITGLCMAFLLLGFTDLQAQCPGGISMGGALTIGDAASCTPESGMIQWDGTTLQVYDGSSWLNLSGGSSGSGHWSPNANGIDYAGGNVGIGTNTPTSKLHVSDILTVNGESAQKIDFQHLGNSNIVYGLHIESSQKTNKGTQFGAFAKTSASFGGNTGEATSFLSHTKSFSADGSFTGVVGGVSSTSLSAISSGTTNLIGGSFGVNSTTNVTLGDGAFWIAGSQSVLNGNINNTPDNGAVAAVIGRDLSTGTAQSWAGYFEGKGHFSEKVSIGTTDIPTLAGTLDVSNFNLFVTGGILTEEVVVRLESDWADYVFEPGYDLKSLEEVEATIEKEGHLHNTPSAQEIEDNGIQVGKMMVNQQEKIEELFLHLIEMKKEMDALKAENGSLKAEVKTLQRQ